MSRQAIVSRPGFTVKCKDGRNYCADNLAVASHGQRWCLTFICSGQMIVVLAGDVEAVEFRPVDTTHCIHCDETLRSWPCWEEETYVRWIGANEISS